MSTVPAHRGDPRWAESGWAGLLVRMLLPILVSVAFGLIILGDQLTRTHEMRVIAPDEAIPGAPIPVRAVLFVDIDRHGAPAARPIDAFLEAPSGGFRSARVRLRSSRVLGSEGELMAPRGAPSELRVVVEARAPGGARIRASRPLRLHPDAAKPRRRAWRTADLGPRSLDRPSPADRPLELAFPFGACVPELSCRLSVQVGAPPASLSIEPVSGVVLVAAPDPSPTSSIVEAEVVVRGSEAWVDLVATREGGEVARRRARLPLAPGGIAVSVDHPRVAAGGDPGVVVRLLDPRPLALDHFHEGRWVAARSVDATEATRLALPSLAPGLHRVQVSRYLFTPDPEDLTAVGLFVVGEAAPAPAPLARRDLAPLTMERIEVPEPASIGAAERAAADRAHRRLRLIGAFLCLGAGLTTALLVIQRGLAADREALALGRAEGSSLDAPVAGPSAELLAYGGLLFLAFGAVGVLVYAYRL